MLLLPHWDPGARAAFYNLNLGTSHGEMARAILEGIAVEMKGSLELIESLCGKVATLSVAGGMTKSDLFNQIQSDVFDRPVLRFRDSEATSLGAWIAAAVTCGLESSHAGAFARVGAADSARRYTPDAARHDVYDAQCRRSRALYQALAAPDLREAFA